MDYNVVFFLEDLIKIRTKTFRIGIVKSVWKKTGLYLLSCKVVIARMRLYAKFIIDE